MNPDDEYSLYPKDRARAFLEKKKAPAAVIPKAASATILKFSARPLGAHRRRRHRRPAVSGRGRGLDDHEYRGMDAI